jgi:hypothetical protein
LINPNYNVTLIKKGKEFTTVKENSWIGVVEYMMTEKEKKLQAVDTNEADFKEVTYWIKDKQGNKQMIKKKKSTRPKIKWQLDAIVKETENEVELEDTIYIDEEDPVYVYEFPLRVKII